MEAVAVRCGLRSLDAAARLVTADWRTALRDPCSGWRCPTATGTTFLPRRRRVRDDRLEEEPGHKTTARDRQKASRQRDRVISKHRIRRAARAMSNSMKETDRREARASPQRPQETARRRRRPPPVRAGSRTAREGRAHPGTPHDVPQLHHAAVRAGHLHLRLRRRAPSVGSPTTTSGTSSATRFARSIGPELADSLPDTGPMLHQWNHFQRKIKKNDWLTLLHDAQRDTAAERALDMGMFDPTERFHITDPDRHLTRHLRRQGLHLPLEVPRRRTEQGQQGDRRSPHRPALRPQHQVVARSWHPRHPCRFRRRDHRQDSRAKTRTSSSGASRAPTPGLACPTTAPASSSTWKP